MSIETPHNRSRYLAAAVGLRARAGLGLLVWLTLFGVEPLQAIAQHTVQDVRFQSKRDSTRVVIHTDHPVKYTIGRLRQPDRLYLDLLKTRRAPGWNPTQYAVDDARVRAIRMAQHRTGVMRIVLDLNPIHDYAVFSLRSPHRIVIDVQGEPGPAPPTAESKPPIVEPTVVPTIVIDPGHGGKDPGAIGKRGLKEKDVVLKVALALRDLIRQKLPAYPVILTREKDVFIPLEKRAKMANDQDAGVFLSIHANASKRGQARGIETWYLSFAVNNERAKRIAARENNMSSSQLSELQLILRDLHQTDRINQSALLAGMTQTALVTHINKHYTKLPNRGVEGAPFMVLHRTDMPSVLVEVGFLSNLAEEKLLRKRAYQNALAEGLFHGIRDFLQKSVVQAE